jgi:hypothetical protein
MAMSEVISLMTAAGAMGIYDIDEWREMTGHEPLPNGEGAYRPRGYNNLDGEETKPVDNGGVTE